MADNRLSARDRIAAMLAEKAAGPSRPAAVLTAKQVQAERQWQELSTRENDLYEQLCRCATPSPDASHRDLVLRWWGAVADVLNEYRANLHRFGTGDGPAPLPLTMDLANRLANFTGELAAGNIPNEVRELSSRLRLIECTRCCTGTSSCNRSIP